jgi:hypothetical protein
MALFVCAVKVYPERGALGLWDFFTGNLAKLHPVKLKKQLTSFGGTKNCGLPSLKFQQTISSSGPWI